MPLRSAPYPPASRSGTGKASPALDISVEQEGRLRRRLYVWARDDLGLSAEDFGDMYQSAWCALRRLQQSASTYGSLELSLRQLLEWRWGHELRRRERRATVPLETIDEDAMLDVHQNPVDRVERLQDARYLLEAVSALTDRQRQILLLADVWELRPADVATRLGLSPRTYRREHTRALAAVTAHLGQLLDGDWCERHRPLLTLYVHGRTTPEQHQLITRHLANCLTCRRDLANQRCEHSAPAPAGAVA